MEIQIINDRERWIKIDGVAFKAKLFYFDNDVYCRIEIKQMNWVKGMPVWKSDSHSARDTHLAYEQALKRLQAAPAIHQPSLL